MVDFTSLRIMTNKNLNYHYSDFTLLNYKRLVNIAKQRYNFISYDKIDYDVKFALWRHDVDCSIDYAYELAKIDYECGVKSFFFILLHSDFYNPFEYSSTKKIKQILSLNHDVGLHFDSGYYLTDSLELLEKKLITEKKILENIFNIEIKAFSFHNPTSFELSLNELYYGDCINVYAHTIRDKVAYCSDSNGYWIHSRLEDFLKDESHSYIQILTHPEWWQEEIRSPKERIKVIIKNRANNTWDSYKKILYENGRKIIG